MIRRAGHSMLSYEAQLYLFGGRSIEAGALHAMNDLWMFNEAERVWKPFEYKGEMVSEIPVGRQHSAMAMLQVIPILITFII